MMTIKRCIIRAQEWHVGGRKRFPTLPKFLSSHMTGTCGYTLRGRIHLNVYGHAPAHHNISQSLVAHSITRGKNGIHIHMFYSITKLFWWPVQKKNGQIQI